MDAMPRADLILTALTGYHRAKQSKVTDSPYDSLPGIIYRNA